MLFRSIPGSQRVDNQDKQLWLHGGERATVRPIGRRGCLRQAQPCRGERAYQPDGQRPRSYKIAGRWTEIENDDIFVQFKNEKAAFSIASTYDYLNAYESTSYGLGQIMGYNYNDLRSLGITSAMDLYDVSSQGMSKQLEILMVFLRDSKFTLPEVGNKTMLELLREGNYLSFSKLYNGSYAYYYNQEINGYKIEGLGTLIERYREVIGSK